MPVGKFKPPAMGRAVPGAKRLMRKVYESCRTTRFTGETAHAKRRCAEISWGVVKKQFKKVKGKWVPKK